MQHVFHELVSYEPHHSNLSAYLQAAAGRSKQHDSLLRQALVGSHLSSSPKHSPAIIWTVTPDAAQVASGQIHQTAGLAPSAVSNLPDCA
jgi:hypothetical protein